MTPEADPLVRAEHLDRLYNLVANLAHPRGDHKQNVLEDEAHDIIRELRGYLNVERAARDSAEAHLEAQAVALRELVAQWREMVKLAWAEGPIPHDEAGHAGRWTAVEMCADELDALIARPTQEPR